MDLREAEDIKMRWQEYTELYKNDLYDPDNLDGVITHLETNILECEVKWALGSISTNKTGGVDRISAELLQILKDGADKSATLNMLANLYNSTVATGLASPKKRAMPKNVQITTQSHSFHMLAQYT